MNVNFILSIVMVIVGLVFLVLSFVFPEEIQIGAFIASFAIAAVFYALSKRRKNNIHES